MAKGFVCDRFLVATSHVASYTARDVSIQTMKPDELSVNSEMNIHVEAYDDRMETSASSLAPFIDFLREQRLMSETFYHWKAFHLKLQIKVAKKSFEQERKHSHSLRGVISFLTETLKRKKILYEAFSKWKQETNNEKPKSVSNNVQDDRGSRFSSAIANVVHRTLSRKAVFWQWKSFVDEQKVSELRTRFNEAAALAINYDSHSADMKSSAAVTVDEEKIMKTSNVHDIGVLSADLIMRNLTKEVNSKDTCESLCIF